MSDKLKNTVPTWRLLLVVVIFVAPIIIAYWLYMARKDFNFETTNYGEFLQPFIAAETLAPLDGNQQTVNFINNDGIWFLLYLQQGACSDDCRLNLEKLHTTRLALGRNINLLQNIAIVTPDNFASLTAQPPQSVFYAASSSENIQRVLQEHQAAFVLVDPKGNIMMRYASDAQGNGILRDVRKLLQVSSHG